MVSVGVAQQTTPAPAVAAAPLERLVAETNIPFEQFTLANGLRVIVHTDRKAPIVAVSVWYGVGSGSEPKGKTGFAHLFEHLMFNGSGNYDGEFFVPLEEIGATDYNGTTWLDRTNYFQNVPTPALDLALFLEADRMGNLLPAVTQEKLDNQRGVVQNEKRQGDNAPYGLVNYSVQGTLFPEGHPYHHSTIGSMADLDAASMDDVRAWFRQFYGPNNAVVVLAGDIDVRTARPLMERYFGPIPRGPDVARPTAGVPDRTEISRTTIRDRVSNARIYLNYATPSQLKQESVSLDIALAILAGGQSSRLHNALVRTEQLAISVGGGQQPFQLSSIGRIVVDVKPGVDPAKVEQRVDEIIKDFIANGPTDEEVRRVATRTVSGQVRGLEQIGGFGGKAVALAQGTLYANDPSFYRTQLNWMATATPASVKAAAAQWLNDGSHRVLVEPGERGPAELALAGVAVTRPPAATPPTAKAPDRSKLPRVNGEAQLAFPAIERATLSNGVSVTFARRTGVPIVSISARFDAGISADDPQKLGLQTLMTDMMREGTATRTGRQIVEAYELLGAASNSGASQDETSFSVVALKPNLTQTLGVFADVIRNPAFTPPELARVRAIQLGRIGQELNTPNAIGLRALTPMLYGQGHPYANPSALGTVEGVNAITRDDLVRFHKTWIRPDNMRLFVVGDTTLAEIKAQLETAFGSWRAPTDVAKGVKTFGAVQPQGAGKIILINRPNSPQSVIFGGMPLIGVRGTDDPIALRIGNEVLGGSFTSRLNSDLRETKGWSYGVRSQVSAPRNDAAFFIVAPVQADRTADSIQALKDNVTAYLSDKPIAADEFARAVNSNARGLPGDFETAAAVRSALEQNALLGRPDSYVQQLPARYRGLRSEEVMAAVRRSIDPSKLVWVVVGDAATVEPQLQKLGMPIEKR